MEHTTAHVHGSPRPQGYRVTRRQVILGGGVALVGITFLGSPVELAWGQASQLPGVMTKNGGAKPIFVAEPRSTDPVAHSLAENLFWTDILMEHAQFFVMLMPGPELAAQRRQAEQFQATLASQFDKARHAQFDRSTEVGFNRATIELVKPFIEFKRTMQDAQADGRIRSLAWPTFFDHTALEAEYFVQRLTQLSRGNVELDRSELADFWTRIMFDHAAFIAHLLDPQEVKLIEKANKTAWTFRNLHEQRPLATGAGNDPLLHAAEEVVDFKTVTEKGISAGKIKSIIHPAIAGHVRREAVKFVDELQRTSARAAAGR
jgi:hypothetical protein